MQENANELTNEHQTLFIRFEMTTVIWSFVGEVGSKKPIGTVFFCKKKKQKYNQLIWLRYNGI